MWIATFVRTAEEVEGIAPLRNFCRGVEPVAIHRASALAQPLQFARYLLAGIPPDLRMYQRSQMAERIRDLISKVNFDIIQIENSFMAPYLQAIPLEQRNRTVLTFHDVVFSKTSRIAQVEPKLGRKLRLWLHAAMMRRWEPQYAQGFGCCLVVSEVDQHLLEAANPNLWSEVIPNGVDTRRLQLLPEPKSGTKRLLFVGNMGYRPNVDAVVHFCHAILPRIRHDIPDVELWIVGTNPAAEVTALQENTIHVTGYVDDVLPYYRDCLACVVPLRAGGGTRLKILEAMAIGCPVITTSIGCEGLDVTDGLQVFIADGAEDFAAKTVQLLTSGALRARMRQRARELVVSCYDWDVIVQKLESVYERIASGKGKPYAFSY
jgi:glycosyltransferase involved in cell wall biosynthesis